MAHATRRVSGSFWLTAVTVAGVVAWIGGGAAAQGKQLPAEQRSAEVQGSTLEQGAQRGPTRGTRRHLLVRRDQTGAGDYREDRTLAPFFFVPGGDSQVDRLPLKATRASVTIAGVIADVRLTQEYRNEGARSLEASYVFPASTRAAVYAMTMTIGTRTIAAEIRERDQARREYEQARTEGRTASLLEQQRPNVFQMDVANIQPGDVITAELRYTEMLVPDDGIYTFVLPTVVGPRYSNLPAEEAAPKDRWVRNPYLEEGVPSPFPFAFEAVIAAGMPLAEVFSPSHDLVAEFTGMESVRLHLDPSRDAGNRDVVVRYRLAGNAIQSGVLVHRDRDESFFLLMVEPPAEVATAEIVPREYIFIVDVSGSMHGFPLDITKVLMRDLLSALRPGDFFNVMLFESNNAVLAERSVPASAASVQAALELLDRQRGGGGTELLPALRRALALPRPEQRMSRTVVIATDGYVSVERDAFSTIREALGEANLFAFGIGSSVNRHLIEGMARAGQGEPFVVLRPEEAAAEAARFRRMILAPVLTGIRVTVDGADGWELEPAILPDLFALRPLVLTGRCAGALRGAVTVTGTTSTGPFHVRVNLAREARTLADGEVLGRLWARQRIQHLADLESLDHSPQRRRELLRLGLRYSLLTDVTSFVALDSLVRGDGAPVPVQQPLPLPAGVSNLAVGGGIPAQPATFRASLADLERNEARRGSGKKAGLPMERPALPDPASTAPQPVLQVSWVVVSGPLAEHTVREVLEAVLTELEGGSGFSGGSGAGRVITVRISVAASGRVAKVDVVNDTVALPAVTARLIEGLSRAVFPRAHPGGATTITAVLRLSH